MTGRNRFAKPKDIGEQVLATFRAIGTSIANDDGPE
jgi:hypothetical protein